MSDTEALVEPEKIEPMLLSVEEVKMDSTAQTYAALRVTSGALIAGMALSWSSPALASIESDMSLDSGSVSWLVSLVPVGGLIACIPAGWLMDSFGRKGTLVRTSMLFSIGWLFLAMNFSVYLLYLGRLLTGICTGCYLVVIPTYIAEIAHVRLRGQLGSLIQVMITIGVFMTFVFGAVVQWQMLSLICFLTSLVSAYYIYTLPETPCFLLQIGESSEAKVVLKSLRGRGYTGYKEELLEIEESISGDGKTDFGVDFQDPEFYKPLIVSVGLMLNQQLSGVNNVMFYLSTIFKAAGSNMNENLQAILVGFSQVVASIAGTFFIDRLGRRLLLQASNAVVGLSLFLLGLYFHWASVDEGSVGALGALPLFSCISFIVGFSLALGPVPWLMMGELFPVRFRGTASGIASCVNWTTAFLTTKSFPASMAIFGLYGTFWSYAVFVMIGAIFVQRYVPETKGKSSNEIAAYFGSAPAHVA